MDAKVYKTSIFYRLYYRTYELNEDTLDISIENMSNDFDDLLEAKKQLRLYRRLLKSQKRDRTNKYILSVSKDEEDLLLIGWVWDIQGIKAITHNYMYFEEDPVILDKEDGKCG